MIDLPGRAAIVAISVAPLVLTRVSVSYPLAERRRHGPGRRPIVCMLYRLIDPPADGVIAAIAAWLGLVAAGVTYGGYLGMQECDPRVEPAMVLLAGVCAGR